MTVAVSAAAGRLGRSVLSHLLESGAVGTPVAIVRSPERVMLPGVEVRQGDYSDPAGMQAVLRGIDTLVLISAPVGSGDRVSLHRSAIRAARLAGVERVIYTSVIGNGKERVTAFRATQQVNRQAEEDLRHSGLAWTIGRNGLYLDLDTAHILRAAETDGVYRNNGGDGRCGYLSIDELGCAYAALAASPGHAGRIYNLAGEPLTQAGIVAAVSDVFGVRVRYEPISSERNFKRFMADPGIAARGEAVARMLTACFDCIALGAFDVPVEFEAAVGRPAKTLRRQLEEIRRTRRSG